MQEDRKKEYECWIEITANKEYLLDVAKFRDAMENCKNITLKNIEIRHSHPDMHELKVVRKGLFTVDFEIDPDTQYEFINGKAYIYAKDYRYAIDHKANNSWWIGQIRKNTPNKIVRVNHPLFSAFKYCDLGDKKFRVY